MIIVGIDTGGTFTDLVLWRDGRVRTHKVLSTPAAPEQAILRGIAELGLDPAGLHVIHGSTVATNAVLEGKGVRTLYVANRGLGDLLTIGRQARPDLYDLQPPARLPPVPPELCVETGGRLGADGDWVEPLTAADLDALKTTVMRLAPESVAINLLFSYLDDSAERALEDAMPEGLFVARSSEVLPLVGEYERGIATWINARIGPIVARYIGRLADGLSGARVSVMQSSGEAVTANQAARHTARLLLSGPAGGLAGAAFAAAQTGCPRLLTFDMGGTSTDVAVVDGEPRLTTDGHIAGFPVALPMVDMHTIGAGGGSIARLDAGGMLLVGPESAGADPGPACYDRGGREATVTDANLVLGRLDPNGFLGGRMRLNPDAARAALGRLAHTMGLSIEETALGVIRLADEHMARALRVISVQRGLDPRDFILTSFGGAGGLHVCALAEALGMTRALVPVHAGVLSALGMLVTPAGRTLTRTRLGLLADAGDAEIAAALDALAESGITELEQEGVARADLRVERSLDLRYRGQSHTLNLHWASVADAIAAFHAQHRDRYGHRLDLPVELVNLRVRVRGPIPNLELPPIGASGRGSPTGSSAAYGCPTPVACWTREDLGQGRGLLGPAIIADALATTWLAPGWRADLDAVGNLMLQRAVGEKP
ncbi:hydantoinase/oxoprolinase family protein [Thiocapsa roseopersicina]|uniref:N-methylhydantoinase A n=1 Tax=Thiocapsa roseopersicina TaxID=1058 RepID=A0A1H2V6T8_THIRO|nr:hydantoinase/oxoprolinase family protein [Thiocapsa roseopersicina]SDW63619.1 N-methylhydantoinase A [Thiocapsa roseopersicina]